MRIGVFGVPIYATAGTDEAKVRHAAHVLAQYLDNDEDCIVDDPAVVEAMREAGAAIIMAPTEDALPFEIEGQPLFGDETHPGGAERGRFDATLEEVLHLVTSVGYASAYPDEFGEGPGTALTDAMDVARGGHFERIPRAYPESAWYHYDDRTCDYRCMAAEYVYWGLTTWLGAQDFPGRCEDIAVEWELCSAADFEAVDLALHALLTDSRFHLPTALPDGHYRTTP